MAPLTVTSVKLFSVFRDSGILASSARDIKTRCCWHIMLLLSPRSHLRKAAGAICWTAWDSIAPHDQNLHCIHRPPLRRLNEIAGLESVEVRLLAGSGSGNAYSI
ncbi:hypothetical protein CLCR_07790 [Cladophialophora carrionii]|uniref:Uncharacterized protein n=1 Tax=Cladophialophora carrionii TaxID=86049 RepID=A0A1C1CPJ3_9EURO|nr:hypothetical protein CLCR_07790 [Cladophialophora carrionii]